MGKVVVEGRLVCGGGSEVAGRAQALAVGGLMMGGRLWVVGGSYVGEGERVRRPSRAWLTCNLPELIHTIKNIVIVFIVFF